MTTALQARREVRRHAHGALLALPGVHEVITVNDDFTDALSDVRYLLRTRKPLVLGAQESKRTDYRAQLDDRWGVRQLMTDESTAGVAVVWDRQRAKATGGTRNHPRLLGSGYKPLVVPTHGEDMLTRGIVWQDLELVHDGGIFCMASTHRPPQRHAHLWPEFDDALEAWLEARPVPVVLATDNNQAGGPNVDDDHWRWRGIGIDGLVSDLRVLSVFELDYRNSDHRPVSGALRTAGLPS